MKKLNELKTDTYQRDAIVKLTKKLLSLGFRVWVAEKGSYGFYSDESGSRVCDFQVDYFFISFSGNYSSSNSGTGWRISKDEEFTITNEGVHITKEKASKMLHCNTWVRDPKIVYTTLDQKLKSYSFECSKYSEVVL